MKMRNVFLASFTLSACSVVAFAAPHAEAVSRLTPGIQCAPVDDSTSYTRIGHLADGSKMRGDTNYQNGSFTYSRWNCPFRDDKGSTATLQHDEIDELQIHGYAVEDDYCGDAQCGVMRITASACLKDWNSSWMSCGASATTPNSVGIFSLELSGASQLDNIWGLAGHSGDHAYVAIDIPDPGRNLISSYPSQYETVWTTVYGFWATE